MSMSLRDRSTARSMTMKILLYESLYPPNMPSVHSKNYLLDQTAWRSIKFKDARKIIQEFYDRIKAGGELTERELLYFDDFCYQAGYLVRNGNLEDREVYIDGVYMRAISSMTEKEATALFRKEKELSVA